MTPESYTDPLAGESTTQPELQLAAVREFAERLLRLHELRSAEEAKLIVQQVIDRCDTQPSTAKKVTDARKMRALYEAGTTGADMSPGNPLCRWAYEEILRLKT